VRVWAAKDSETGNKSCAASRAIQSSTVPAGVSGDAGEAGDTDAEQLMGQRVEGYDDLGGEGQCCERNSGC
jgi:hypothetical protein